MMVVDRVEYNAVRSCEDAKTLTMMIVVRCGCVIGVIAQAMRGWWGWV